MKKTEGMYFFNDSSDVDVIANAVSILYPSVSFAYNSKSIMIVADEKGEFDCVIDSIKTLEELHIENMEKTAN